MSNMPAASTTTTTTTATATSPAPARKRRAARSQTLDAAIGRARVIADALVPLLARIAAADADAASVRIDASWVANLNGVIAQAEDSQGTRATALVAQKEATKAEQQVATQLASALTNVRELVATHAPADLGAQQAFGRGTKIDPRRTTLLLATAQGFAKAYAGTWKETAIAANVTQAMIDQISMLAEQLAKAGTAQHAARTSGAQGTLSREAAIAALRTMSAFAVRVVTGIFGKSSPELTTLADPRPLQARGAARKAATKAKAKAKAAQVRAKKAASRAKPGARGKTRARKAKRVAVATQRAALVQTPTKASSSSNGKATRRSTAPASTLAEPLSQYARTPSKSSKAVSTAKKAVSTGKKTGAKPKKAVSTGKKTGAKPGKTVSTPEKAVSTREKTSTTRGKTTATAT